MPNRLWEFGNPSEIRAKSVNLCLSCYFERHDLHDKNQSCKCSCKWEGKDA